MPPVVTVAPADAPHAAVPVDAAPPPTAGATVAAAKRAHPTLLAADATGAYWVEQGDDAFTVFHVSAGKSPETLVKGAGRATALAADAGTLYFLADGANGFDLFRVRAGRGERVAANIGAEQLAVDASGVYLGTGGGNILALTGKGKPVSIAGSVEFSFMSQIATDDKSVYFSNELDDTPKRIYRVAKTGGDVYRVDAGHVGAWGVGAHAVYYDHDGAIWSVPKQGDSWQHPTEGADPKPVRVRTGSLLAATSDRLYFLDAGHVGIRDPAELAINLATSAETMTSLTLADDITGVAVASGHLWLTRDDDVLMFTP